MNYSVIKTFDIADGPGCRTTLFVSGCRNHCEGCFQSETWDFDFGEPFTRETQDELFGTLEMPYTQGLTLLGGDPMEPENQEALVPFLRLFREKFGDTKDIWAYTGYVLERDLAPGGRRHTPVTDEFLSMIDVLVDGPFVQAKKDITLLFRGSSNQRLIDMKKTRERGEAVLWEEVPK